MSSNYRHRPLNLQKMRSKRENAARSAAISRMRGSSIARAAGKCCGRRGERLGEIMLYANDEINGMIEE